MRKALSDICKYSNHRVEEYFTHIKVEMFQYEKKKILYHDILCSKIYVKITHKVYFIYISFSS